MPQVANLTIVPVSDMHHAGQLLDYVRIKYRRKVHFSGLPILLQLKSNDWHQYLQKLRQAFEQQNEISDGLDKVPDMLDWNVSLSQLKQRHLLVLRLLAPDSKEILCRLIQWAVTSKKSTKSLFAIVAVDQQLLDHRLVKQALKIAGSKVDIFIHDGTHDGPKHKPTRALWLMIGLLVLAVIGGWSWLRTTEWFNPGTPVDQKVANEPGQTGMAENQAGLFESTGTSEIWDYHVESEWFKQLSDTELSQQYNDQAGYAESADRTIGADDAEAPSIRYPLTDRNGIDDPELKISEQQQIFASTFHVALANNDLQWLRANAEALSRWHAADGQSALMILAEGNHAEWVNMLLEQGADANESSLRNWTPLLITAIFGQFEVARVLLESGADPAQLTDQGRSALMAAVHNRHPDLTELLLRFGADVNQQGKDGWSALFYAVWNQDASLVELLLAAGARKDLVTSTGNRVIDIAQQRNNQQILSLLGS